jgi:hypothetical protein
VLLYADRTPKFPLEEIARATRGPISQREQEHESSWRERLMGRQRQQYRVPAEDYKMQEGR